MVRITVVSMTNGICAISGEIQVAEQFNPDYRPYSLVRQHRRMLANLNIYLEPGASVLDFGCGSGAAVYEYRDAGYDAYGFDIRNVTALRDSGDQRLFRFALVRQAANVPECRIHASTYRIPFEDERFDFVFSTSTLEHVTDHALVFSEIARVLRSGGTSIHTFPAKWSPIEPHTKVPFGGGIQSYGWFLIWAAVGFAMSFRATWV
jgi:SAM-dependent methyltransferase